MPTFQKLHECFNQLKKLYDDKSTERGGETALNTKEKELLCFALPRLFEMAEKGEGLIAYYPSGALAGQEKIAYLNALFAKDKDSLFRRATWPQPYEIAINKGVYFQLHSLEYYRVLLKVIAPKEEELESEVFTGINVLLEASCILARAGLVEFLLKEYGKGLLDGARNHSTTPLMYAVLNCNQDNLAKMKSIIVLLCANGADINKKSPILTNRFVRDLRLITDPRICEPAPFKEYNALTLAMHPAFNIPEEMKEFLIQNGARPLAKSSEDHLSIEEKNQSEVLSEKKTSIKARL